MFTALAWSIAVLNLIGSLTSFLGSGFIVITYLILPLKRHFRHSLILNLAIADFINSINNSISGLWRLTTRQEIPDGPGCTANGFVGQLTVQATDTSILAIAIVTVWSLTRKTMIRETLPRTTTFIICASTWILPATTAFIVLGMNRYGPVSGNWCWIIAEPSYFRYVMTHGWRFAFIILEISMYTYLHFYIRKRFGAVLGAGHGSSHNHNTTIARSTVNETVHTHSRNPSQVPITMPAEAHGQRVGDLESNGYIKTETWVSQSYDDKGPAHEVKTTISSDSLPHHTDERPESVHSKRPKFSNPFAHRRAEDKDLDVEEPKEATNNVSKKVKQENATRSKRIRRILLLNAYPAMYIILWIPGIINRLIEASGSSSPVMQVLQASTQFVGLANAITYGWNERVGTQLRDFLSDKWGLRRTRSVEELPKIELRSNLKLKLQGSKERLRELRDGMGLKKEELPEDQGHLMYVNGKWEWTRSTSFHSHDGDADGSEFEVGPRRD
ncbi:hypothetical protein AA313_de0209220 [Arthrobotrys entomopaga]|nr:hypothetical protein AA313_de0209220 [Arthrobotrys entomopaga]